LSIITWPTSIIRSAGRLASQMLGPTDQYVEQIGDNVSGLRFTSSGIVVDERRPASA
jgi:hypothetical protein